MSNTKNYREVLNEVMNELMTKNKKAILIGQGVTDFKEIFGSVAGLYKKYPNRVIETPLSEDSIAGTCIGMALNGMFPINTHIRADFSLLMFNQLINLGAKYRYMFGGNYEVPMLFRLVIGRSWGQGAQHSQSLQSLMAHIPGLRVIMPITPNDIHIGYKYAMKEAKGPVISLEHRLAYELTISDFENTKGSFSSYVIKSGKDVTIIATSIMVLEAIRASEFLNNYGISVEIINLNCVSHIDEDIIINSIKKTRHVLIADTSWVSYGVGSEVSRIIAENTLNILKKPIKTLGMTPVPCPTAKSLEDLYYPELIDLIKSVIDLLDIKNNDIKLPKRQSMTDFYKHFKGPF